MNSFNKQVEAHLKRVNNGYNPHIDKRVKLDDSCPEVQEAVDSPDYLTAFGHLPINQI